jgi:GTPase
MLRNYIEKKIPIPREIEMGNIEYKRRLDLKDKHKLKKMVSQMLWRLNEGKIINGKCEASYYLGINDDGSFGHIDEQALTESIEILKNVAIKGQADITNIDIIIYEDSYIAELSIQKKVDGNFINEIRTCLLGTSNCGKSTMLGLLTHDQADDGNGLSRSLVLKHSHEQNSGITSSIKHDIIGFKHNKLINYKYGTYSSWEDIVMNSNKIISIYDLPAFSKYIKTAIFGLLSMKPHFNVVVVSSACDVLPTDILMIFKLSILMKIPFLIIFTKNDIQKTNSETIKLLESIIQNYGLTSYKLIEFSNETIFNEIIPFINISNTIFTDLSKISGLINVFSEYISKYHDVKTIDDPDDIEFIINETFDIPDKGIIASGLMKTGRLDINKSYFIGPIKEDFYPIQIKTILKKQIDSKSIYKNETGCIEFKIHGNVDINKNLVIIMKSHETLVNKIYIDIMEDISQLKIGFQYMLHYDNNMEAIIVLDIEKKTRRIFVQFVKEYKKYIGKNIYCILRGDYKPDVCIVGKL